jgi:putative transposase
VPDARSVQSRRPPRVLVTDKLGSYGGAHRELMASVEHLRSRYLTNRAKNSHQPTRQRERIRAHRRSPDYVPRRQVNNKGHNGRA